MVSARRSLGRWKEASGGERSKTVRNKDLNRIELN